jgi:hypothetical protein
MSSDIQHTDVAAYALGLLDEHDRRAFEAHLAVCELCIVELADFSGMREMFAGIRPAVELLEEEPAELAYDPRSADNVVSMLRRRQAADRRKLKSQLLLGAAAAVALLAGGVTAGATMLPREQPASKPQSASVKPSPDPLGKGERVSATDPRSQAQGTVAMTPRVWGTDIILQFSHVRGPLECRLIAVPRKGRAQLLSGWSVPQKGYGVPGSPEPLIVHGATALQRPDIDHFEVRVKGGGKLLTIPA